MNLSRYADNEYGADMLGRAVGSPFAEAENRAMAVKLGEINRARNTAGVDDKDISKDFRFLAGQAALIEWRDQLLTTAAQRLAGHKAKE